MMKKNNIVFYLSYLFILFPLIPNRIKGLPVIILLVTSIIVFIKNKTKKYPYKKVLLLSSLYLMYLISLIYTDNLKNIDKVLSTRLSLLVVPIAFGFLYQKVKEITHKNIISLIKVNSIVTTIYSILILSYLWYLGVFNDAINIESALAYITNEMWLINQHPIYASFFIGISILLTLYYIAHERENKWCVLGVIIMVITLFVLTRKSVLIALFFSIVSWFLLYKKRKTIKRYIIAFFAVIMLVFVFSKTVSGRFYELINKETYVGLNEENSTSLRYNIYVCSIKSILRSPFLGYGVGDVKQELNKCYNELSIDMVYYNSHNQYISFYLGTGVFGFVLLWFIMLKKIFLAIKKKKVLLLTLSIFFTVLMLFENILERQSGVILFSFYMCLLSFANFKKMKVINEER